MLEQGQSVRSPPPEEEGAAETTCGDCNPHSPSSHATRQKEVENSGEKLSLGRRQGWREGVFKVCFCFLIILLQFDW